MHRLVLSQMQDAIFTYVRLYNVCANLFLQTVPTNTSPAIQCTAYFPHFAVLHNSYHYTPLYTVPLYFSCRPLSGTGRLLKGLPRAFSSLHTLNNPSSLSLILTGEVLQPPDRICGPPWIRISMSTCAGPCASYAWGPRAEHHSPGGVSGEGSLWVELSPLACWPCCF